MSIDKLNPRKALGFLTWKISRMSANDLTSRFAEAGIPVTVEQWRVLVTVAKKQRVTQGRLCDIMSQEKTGVSRLVAALEKSGFLVRESDKDDRRVKHIQITPAGREVVESTVSLALQSRDELVADIDPDELEICLRVLWQVIHSSLDPDSECFSEK